MVRRALAETEGMTERTTPGTEALALLAVGGAGELAPLVAVSIFEFAGLALALVESVAGFGFLRGLAGVTRFGFAGDGWRVLGISVCGRADASGKG